MSEKKDKLLQRFVSSPRFRRMSMQQRSVELHDYKWQQKDFESRRLDKEVSHE